MALGDRLHRLRHFVLHGLWHDIPTPSRLKARAIQGVRVAVLAGRGFLADRCFLRATSLAYVTLLSLVPLLALAFAVLRGLEVGNKEVLRDWIISRVVGSPEGVVDEGGERPRAQPGPAAPDGARPAADRPEDQVLKGQRELVGKLIGYVENTNVKALGTIGLLILLWTTLKLLSTIEAYFNHIWKVRRSRALLRKIADYVSVLVITPILLFAVMALTAAFQRTDFINWMRGTVVLGFATEFIFSWLRHLGTWIAFGALYIFMPNTKVRLLPALVGGVIAGSVWQVAFWGYTHFQVGVAREGAIYGTFAALPIFMVWLYVSWTIVLLGAEIACAAQNVGRYGDEQRAAGASFAAQEAVAVRLMTALSTAFYRDGASLTIEQIADRCRAPSRLVAEVLQILIAAGHCAEVVHNDGVAYQPGRALETITPADVLDSLRSHGRPLDLRGDDPEAEAARQLLDAHDQAAHAPRLRETSFRDVAIRLAAPRDDPAQPPPAQSCE